MLEKTGTSKENDKTLMDGRVDLRGTYGPRRPALPALRALILTIKEYSVQAQRRVFPQNCFDTRPGERLSAPGYSPFIRQLWSKQLDFHLGARLACQISRLQGERREH